MFSFPAISLKQGERSSRQTSVRAEPLHPLVDLTEQHVEEHAARHEI